IAGAVAPLTRRASPHTEAAPSDPCHRRPVRPPLVSARMQCRWARSSRRHARFLELTSTLNGAAEPRRSISGSTPTEQIVESELHHLDVAAAARENVANEERSSDRNNKGAATDA